MKKNRRSRVHDLECQRRKHKAHKGETNRKERVNEQKQGYPEVRATPDASIHVGSRVSV